MSGQHRPGEHSREIDVAALRAWMKAGRPGDGPRSWYHRTRPTTPRRAHAAGPDRWFWWPATIALVLVMGAVFLASAIGSVAAQREQDEQHLIRWCISCHGVSSVEIQPEVDQ